MLAGELLSARAFIDSLIVRPTADDDYVMVVHPTVVGMIVRLRNADWGRDAYLRKRSRRMVRGRR